MILFYLFSGGKSNNSMLLSAIVDGSSDLFVIKFNEKPVSIGFNSGPLPGMRNVSN